jgi:hypothetical protein
MSDRYRNSWHKPGKPEYGPEFYQAYPGDTGKPYRGFLIYSRAACYDVVKDGVCVTQMAGPNGARQAIDSILVNNVDQTVIERDDVAGGVRRAA